MNNATANETDMMNSPAQPLIQAGNAHWRVQAHATRAVLLGVWADPDGKGNFGENLLDASDAPRRPHNHNRLAVPLCGITVARAPQGEASSRDCPASWTVITGTPELAVLQSAEFSLAEGIREQWIVRMSGDELIIRVRREASGTAGEAGRGGLRLHVPRDFAFRRAPDYYDAELECHEVAASRAEPFFLHASGAYCDFEAWAEGGALHLMHRYMTHQAIGFSFPEAGPGVHEAALHLRAVAQGARVPLHLETPDCEAGSLAALFYDTYHLANVAVRGCQGNGPYHGCVCTMDLFGITSPDEIACQKGVPVDAADLRATTRRTLDLVAAGAFDEEVINGVYIKNHWDKGCGGGGNVFMADSGPHFVLGTYNHFVHTGDAAWLNGMLPLVRRAIAITMKLDRDGDGLIESLNTGLPDSRASNFWDEIKYGHKDAYTNAWVYASLRAAAELVEIVDDHEAAASYRGLAARLHESYNEQLWNPATNRYAGWRDIQGDAHDSFYTSPNLLAIIHGLASEERARRILQGIDNSPHAYRLFAISNNLEAPPAGDLSYPQPFGHYENGGVFLINAAWDILARAGHQSPDHAYTRFISVMEQYKQDRLYGRTAYDGSMATPYRNGKQSYQWHRNRCEGSGLEPWLADGASILWAVYRGLLGLVPSAQGLAITPRIPEPMANTTAAVDLHGRKIKVRFNGFGKKVLRITLNGQSQEKARWRWDELPAECEIGFSLEWER